MKKLFFKSKDASARTAFVKPDKSIPLMHSDTSLLKNPDRGLRMETYITLGDKPDSYPGSGEEPFARAKKMVDKYKPDSPTLCQVYVYLCNYNNKPLDDLAFNQLKRYFKIFEDNNIRMLLRFTYSTESVEDAPYRIVKKHLNQLDEWFNFNKELINNTLFCLQTGIIGYWGEGHSTKNLKPWYFAKVISDVRRLAPDGIYTQIRTYDLLEKVAKKDLPYVGIHDDYIIGDLTHKWSFIPNNSKNQSKYNKTINHAKITINDGEMPWGIAKLDDSENGESLNRLDGKSILKQLQEYSLTSFSLEHNYRETDDGKTYSMEEWKNQYLSFEDTKNIGITVNPNLFIDDCGNEVKMSIYDIIRYHLGYQLVLSNYTQDKNEVSFSITNYGFAAPLNFNYLAVIFEDKSTGDFGETQVPSYNKTKLLSGYSDIYTVKIPDNKEPVGIKLSTLKNRKQCVRFANATKFENGIQYFK